MLLESYALEAYRTHAAERAALGIPALPLTAKQTEELVALLLNPPAGEEAFLVELLEKRVPAGVDDAAKVIFSMVGAHAAMYDAVHAYDDDAMVGLVAVIVRHVRPVPGEIGRAHV